MKRIFFVLAAACALLASCSKSENVPSASDYGVVSFDEGESRVAVDADTRSCELKLHYIKMPVDKYYGIWPLVEFDEKKSTALPDVHFVDETIFPLTGNGDAGLTFRLTLIPQNITEEVRLVFKTRATMKGITFYYNEKDGSLDLYGATDPVTGELLYDDSSAYAGFIGETTIVLSPRK